jgi:hypothetical protein
MLKPRFCNKVVASIKMRNSNSYAAKLRLGNHKFFLCEDDILLVNVCLLLILNLNFKVRVGASRFETPCITLTVLANRVWHALRNMVH